MKHLFETAVLHGWFLFINDSDEYLVSGFHEDGEIKRYLRSSNLKAAKKMARKLFDSHAPGKITEVMEDTLGSMGEQISHLEALPFPETMNKAKQCRMQRDVLYTLRELILARKMQIKYAQNDKGTTGFQVLQKMGLA